MLGAVGLAQRIGPCAFLAQPPPLFLLATLISTPHPSLESLWSQLSLRCLPAWSILARRQLELDNIRFLQELNVQRAPLAGAPMSCERQRGENDFETKLKPFPGVPRQLWVVILLGHEWLPGSLAPSTQTPLSPCLAPLVRGPALVCVTELGAGQPCRCREREAPAEPPGSWSPWFPAGCWGFPSTSH